jgi:hypothetical protein
MIAGGQESNQPIIVDVRRTRTAGRFAPIAIAEPGLILNGRPFTVVVRKILLRHGRCRVSQYRFLAKLFQEIM